jgi:hypothetical protein
LFGKPQKPRSPEEKPSILELIDIYLRIIRWKVPFLNYTYVLKKKVCVPMRPFVFIPIRFYRNMYKNKWKRRSHQVPFIFLYVGHLWNITLGLVPRLWLRPASLNLKNTEENPYQKLAWWKPTLRLYFSIGFGGKILLSIVAVGFDPKNFVSNTKVISQNLAWKTHIQNRSRAYNKTKSMGVDNKPIKEKKKTNSCLLRKKNNITKGKNLLVPIRYRGWGNFN